MAKSMFAILCSITITALLFIRLLSVRTTGEIIVIGLLTLFAGFMSFFLIFGKHIYQSKLFLNFKERCGENHVVVFYIITTGFLVVLEIFFVLVPVEGLFFFTLKIIAISFCSISIWLLIIFIRRETKRK
jgi:hypothetical protein